jgi:hypothetical protein
LGGDDGRVIIIKVDFHFDHLTALQIDVASHQHAVDAHRADHRAGRLTSMVGSDAGVPSALRTPRGRRCGPSSHYVAHPITHTASTTVTKASRISLFDNASRFIAAFRSVPRGQEASFTRLTERVTLRR